MNPRRKKRLLITSSLIAGLSLAISLTLYALQQNINLFIRQMKSSMVKMKRVSNLKSVNVYVSVAWY